MESSDTHRGHQGEAKRAGRSERESYEYWKSTVTKEPISEDLKALVRADLKKVWHFHRSSTFRRNRRTEWTALDYYRIVLNDAIGEIGPKQLTYLCNKPTAFYWLQSAYRRFRDKDFNAWGYIRGYLWRVVSKPQRGAKHRVRTFLCKSSENYLGWSHDSAWGH